MIMNKTYLMSKFLFIMGLIGKLFVIVKSDGASLHVPIFSKRFVKLTRLEERMGLINSSFVLIGLHAWNFSHF